MAMIYSVVVLVGLSLLSRRDADGSHNAGPVMLPLQKQDPEDPLLHPRRAVAEIKLANDIDTSKVVDDHVLPSDKLLDDRGCQLVRLR